MKNKKILIITFILVLVISIFGISFALYTYNKTSSNSKLIVGDIYMHYKESNEAILTTAEDTSSFYYNGYLVNSVMSSQTYEEMTEGEDTRNELSKCVDYFNNLIGTNYDDGTTGITYCQGTGTANGYNFQQGIPDALDDTQLTKLKELNIVTSDNKVNPIMASQEYQELDQRNELSKCTDYFYSKYGTSGLPNISQKKYNYLKNNRIIKIKSGGVSYTKSDYIEFCKGTGSIDNIYLKDFISSGTLNDEYLTELSSMKVIKYNNGILSILETGNLTLNENIKNQTYQEDNRNELSKCVDILVDTNDFTLNDATLLCKGETVSDTTLENLFTSGWFDDSVTNSLIEKGVFSSDNTINTAMTNQNYVSDTRNELSKCVDYFYSFPPSYKPPKNGRFLSNNIKTMASTENVNILTNFCQGTGTNDGTETGFNIETIYNNSGVNDILSSKGIIVLEKEQLPYFEFTIDGKNTSNKDIIYNVKLVHGEVFDSKTESNRISDKFLIFKLVEVVDDEEVELVNNKKFDTINNTILYSNKVLKNTNTEIKHIYRLYMIVDPNLIVGNTDRSDYSFDDYTNLFASIKVNVDGDYE